MSDTETFHVGDILSVLTGRLVSPGHMGGVYRILNHLTADNLMTHQLGRAMDECLPHLRDQFPDLAQVEVPEELAGNKAVSEWLRDVVHQYGETREVEAMPDGIHRYRNPLTEAVEMFGEERVIAVSSEPEPPHA